MSSQEIPANMVPLSFLNFGFFVTETSEKKLTWLDRIQHSPIGLQNSIVDILLVFSELPVGWEGASDIRSIAVVFSSHVVQAESEGLRLVYTYQGWVI
jgi:hypothetical protein